MRNQMSANRRAAKKLQKIQRKSVSNVWRCWADKIQGRSMQRSLTQPFWNIPSKNVLMAGFLSFISLNQLRTTLVGGKDRINMCVQQHGVLQ